MSRLNKKVTTEFTHEGAPAKHINAEQQLRRTVMACLLWEGAFYEDGVSVVERIKSLVPLVKPDKVSEMAIEARSEQRLRHVPLLLCRELARIGKLKAETLFQVIQRADELTEFLAIYWQDGKCPLSKQVKLGLAKAFTKFDAYQLAKYDRDGSVKLRDALFLCHAKPKHEKQAEDWKQLVTGTLPTPDTWETGLSGGGDKKEVFTRLLQENNFGYMALLRNLRNMKEVGVDEQLVFDHLVGDAEKSKALPFRYIAAANAVPQWERPIDQAMQKAMEGLPKLKGKTVLMLDHSRSMKSMLSKKSDLNRADAAAGLAIYLSGVAENLECWSFSMEQSRTWSRTRNCELVAPIPPRYGMAMKDAYFNSMGDWGGTELGSALRAIDNGDYDRMIVITDEQSADKVPDPKGNGYMINVATYKNGVGYHKWIHIDGWSESIVRFIVELEAESLR